MNIPCDQRVNCGCSDLPLSNFSSEDPDRFVFLGRHYGFAKTTDIGRDPGTSGCTSFSASTISLTDANLCAAATAAECEEAEAVHDPCMACRGTAPAGAGISGFNIGLGMGFSSTLPSQSDPCCDPDIPSDCCCQSEPSNPDDPPSGGGGDPKNPNNPPRNPRLFCNEEQRCVVECPDGTKSEGIIQACAVMSYSTVMANRIAYAAACKQARERQFCGDDSRGGNPCKVFCLNTTDQEYQLTVTARNGTPVTWSLISGSLPAGMTLDANGLISGTPTATGETSAIIQMEDGEGNTQKRDICFSILGITTDSLPNGQNCTAYNSSIQAEGGYLPYFFGISDGSFPDGLTLNTNGTITGTPYSAGQFGFTVVVTDSLGNACEKDLSITVTGLGNNAVTVTCPTDSSITETCPAGKFAACGPYAGYTQAMLDSLASQDAFNSIASKCPCSGFALSTSPNTENHSFQSGTCHFDMYWILPTVSQNTIHIDAGNSYNLFSEVNTGEGNPVWNPGCVPPIGNIQKPFDGTYFFYSDAGHTKFLFSLSFKFTCP